MAGSVRRENHGEHRPVLDSKFRGPARAAAPRTGGPRRPGSGPREAAPRTVGAEVRRRRGGGPRGAVGAAPRPVPVPPGGGPAELLRAYASRPPGPVRPEAPA